MTDPPCQTLSVMPTTTRTLSGRGVPDRACRNSRRQSRPGQSDVPVRTRPLSAHAGLKMIIAVSENAPGAHRAVPRVGRCSTDGAQAGANGDSAGQRQFWPRDRPMVRGELEGALAIRPAGDVLLGGASEAGSLLLNTKASQEDVCSRAPAAIVPVRSLNHATQV